MITASVMKELRFFSFLTMCFYRLGLQLVEGIYNSEIRRFKQFYYHYFILEGDYSSLNTTYAIAQNIVYRNAWLKTMVRWI